MGRVSRAEAARNRERVVATASALFRARGVENVSIAEIMDAAGLTVGAFYKQFASRDALVQEAFGAAFDQARDAWHETRVREARTRRGKLAALVRRYFSRRAPERTCPMLAFSSAACQRRHGAEVAGTYADGVARLFEQFQAAANPAPGSVGRGNPPAATDGEKSRSAPVSRPMARAIGLQSGHELGPFPIGFASTPPAAHAPGADDDGRDLPEDRVLLLFAAMVGAGLLTRAVGQTAWTEALRAAVVRAAEGGAPQSLAP